MEWLRLYTEARNDAKLRSLSDRQFRIWFNLLCLAAEQSDRGTITGFTEHLLAIEVAGGDTGALQETCIALQALQSVTAVTRDDGTFKITFLKFAKRQYVKPSDRPERVLERVHKSRENKRLREHEEKLGQTVTPVTPPYRDVTPECNATETDLDSKKFLFPSPGGGGSDGSQDRSPAAPLKPTPDGPADPAMMPPFPTENDLLDVGTGTHDLTAAEARDVWRQLWLVSGRSDVCRRFYRKQRQHAAATWLRAVQEAVIRGTDVTGIKIIEIYAGDVECGRINDDAPPAGSRHQARSPPGKTKLTREEQIARDNALLNDTEG